MEKYADLYFKVDAWKIIEEGFRQDYGKVSESIFSLGNEYMGVRGFFDETYTGDAMIGSYFNGIYENNIQHGLGYKGVSNVTEYMVNSVNWLSTRVILDGETLDLHKCRFTDYKRTLDLKTGLLSRTFLWDTASGKQIRVSFERIISMNNVTYGAQRITLCPLNFSGEVLLYMGLDLSVPHYNTKKNLWNSIEYFKEANYLGLSGETETTGQKVFSGCLISGSGLSEPELLKEEKKIGYQYRVAVTSMETTVIERVVENLVSKKASEETEFLQKREICKNQLSNQSFEQLLKQNQSWWNKAWSVSDITIDGDELNQQGIRFCIFQMYQTYHGTVEGTNIGAKGLTGEAYNGNAFWDTETYCLPFYIFHDLEAARNLLMFRYVTLEEAKKRAEALDCKGAFYPIATISGKECCNLWQHASLQLQASTAVAYGIWCYHKLSNDHDFLYQYGLEMLIEISRMLATRGDYDRQHNGYGYYCVMGPDEFQMMVNNNCYTNYMGRFTLQYTLEALEMLKKESKERYEEVIERTKLTQEEIQEFEQIIEHMIILYDENTKLFEQHEGYYKLPHVDINSIPVEDFPLYHHWSYDRIYRNDLIKQPDVLMFLFLFNSSFTKEQLKANYEFYEPNCIHESSLSPSVHSILASQLGKHSEAYEFFKFATRMDLDNYNRNTEEGLHTTSIAAAWMNIVYGFGGMRSDGDILSFCPSIPKTWSSYSFRICYQNEIIYIRVEQGIVEFRTEHGLDLEITVYGQTYQLGKETLRITIPEEWKA